MEQPVATAEKLATLPMEVIERTCGPQSESGSDWEGLEASEIKSRLKKMNAQVLAGRMALAKKKHELSESKFTASSKFVNSVTGTAGAQMKFAERQALIRQFILDNGYNPFDVATDRAPPGRSKPSKRRRQAKAKVETLSAATAQQ